MHKTTVKKDFKEKSILVSREFKAPLQTVWRAFTESELLEKWWAPKPWRTVTFKTVYNSEEEVHKLIEMGFEQGITMTFEELATMLEKGNI